MSTPQTIASRWEAAESAICQCGHVLGVHKETTYNMKCPCSVVVCACEDFIEQDPLETTK